MTTALPTIQMFSTPLAKWRVLSKHSSDHTMEDVSWTTFCACLQCLYFLKYAISTHNFLKFEWIHSRKTSIRPKSSIFPNVCLHKRQYFELLVPEIKCRYSTADLCAHIYANMLNKSYKTKSTVPGRRARWARTNSHASNIKRRTPTQ